MEEYGTCKAFITKHERLLGVATLENLAKSKLNPILLVFPAPFLVLWALLDRHEVIQRSVCPDITTMRSQNGQEKRHSVVG
jgi:hypothetical protein